MATDFTVIIRVRHHFGDEQQDQPIPIDPNIPFAGLSRDFDFTCPGVDRSQEAILQFISFGILPFFVETNHTLQINGNDIFGGLQPGPIHSVANANPIWKTHSLIVHPYVLRDGNNTLRIAVGEPMSDTDNRDNFVIDNATILFKTRPSVLIAETRFSHSL